MKILFLVPYPLNESPSQRFRFEQYFALLASNNYEYHVQSFLSPTNWRLFYSSGKPLQKTLALLTGFVKRFFILFTAPVCDFIFIHREATPLGPPLFEWILAKVFRKKIIYDFDDAIWMTDRKHESFLFRTIKWRRKIGSICRWSYRISCGNNYLCEYAKQFNSQVVVNPTTIDTENVHNPALFRRTDFLDKIVVGWTGSHSTLKYLEQIEGVIKKLEERYPNLVFVVIADAEPKLNLNSLVFRKWSEPTEIEDLAQIDIGVMPLPDNEWAKGKCGFKALQYMALEIPTLASPVGVNTTIITHLKDGILAANDDQWFTSLELLIKDQDLRRTIGEAGRRRVVQAYSVKSNRETFLSLFAR